MAADAVDDPFDAIREAGTDGMNYDLTTDDIVEQLSEWQSLCSFRVTDAGHDTVDIEFDTLPADMDAFVRKLYEFCPDVVDQGTGYIPDIVRGLPERRQESVPDIRKLVEGVDLSSENYGLEILKRELQQKKAITLWWN